MSQNMLQKNLTTCKRVVAIDGYCPFIRWKCPLRLASLNPTKLLWNPVWVKAWSCVK